MRGPRRRGRIVALAEVLERVYPNPADWPTIRAMAAWSRGLPARVVKNARPVRLERGVMLVHVTSPVWSQQLSLLAPELLERIRREPGAAKVRELRFRVGPLPATPPSVEADDRLEAPRRSPPREPELVAALESLDDDALRSAIDRAIDASLVRSSETPVTERTRRTRAPGS